MDRVLEVVGPWGPLAVCMVYGDAAWNWYVVNAVDQDTWDLVSIVPVLWLEGNRQWCSDVTTLQW